MGQLSSSRLEGLVAAMIVLDNVSLRAGAFRLEGIHLLVPAGEYGILMGKTGAGKTSLLEAIIGFQPVVAGSICLAGRDVTQLNPAVRGIGYLPQDGALFSTLTVEENLAFALKIRRVDKKRIASRVRDLAELMGIGQLLKRQTYGLSGGERQRVALGRAMAFEPRILCLDEPLSALDSETREQILQLLMTIKRMNKVTILHVTHNLGEAKLLADKIFRLVNGKIDVSDIVGNCRTSSDMMEATELGPQTVRYM